MFVTGDDGSHETRRFVYYMNVFFFLYLATSHHSSGVGVPLHGHILVCYGGKGTGINGEVGDFGTDR